MTTGREMIPATSRRMARAAHDVDQVAPPARPGQTPRWSRRRGVKSVFAAFAAVGFAAAYVGPMGAAFADVDTAAETTHQYAVALDEAQTIEAADEAAAFTLERDSYSVYVKPKPKPTPKTSTQVRGSAAGLPVKYSGGGSKSEWLSAAGIAESDWGYVDYIVKRESGWNPNATNRSSGACGLVQALPCSKVPGNGYNPVDNLRWANGYAKGRYGSWAKAYAFWTNNHWW